MTRRAAATGCEPAEARESGLPGTPGEVVDKVCRYAEVGATRLCLQVLDLSDLEQVAAEVMPQL